MKPARTGPLAALAMAVCGLSLSACGNSPSATPVSSGARRSLASEVLKVMDANGLPVQDDYIGCTAGRDGRSDSCYGLTSDEPVEKVEGAFATKTGPGQWRTGGCPGTLTVTVGPPISDLDTNSPVHPLQSQRENPCQ